MQIRGKVVNVSINQQGYSSVNIQLDPKNPHDVVIVNGPKDLILKLAAHEELVVTLEEPKS